MAAKLAPHRVKNAKRSLENFMNHSRWNYHNLIDRAVAYSISAITENYPISAWIVDDTGIPKKGTHSVGVSHQYCGQLGKQANCQVSVMLSIANEQVSMPVAYRLYLPEAWIQDAQRRQETHIPSEIIFLTKPQIALSQIDEAIEKGIPTGVVLADAAYGNDTSFRDALTSRSLPYAVAIQSTTSVWHGDIQPLPPKKRLPFGRPPTSLQRDENHKPLSVKALALQLSSDEYQEITWRSATDGNLTSRFACVRVRAAHGEVHTQRKEEWLIIEWPLDEQEPIGYALSTLPAEIDFAELINILHMRWRIERNFQELKTGFGLNEYEGRSWNGFHRHASFCIATYNFLLAVRGIFSPC